MLLFSPFFHVIVDWISSSFRLVKKVVNIKYLTLHQIIIVEQKLPGSGSGSSLREQCLTVLSAVWVQIGGQTKQRSISAHFWVVYFFPVCSTGEWGDWLTQHLHGRRSCISAPYRNGAHLIEGIDSATSATKTSWRPSIKRRMSLLLHRVLSQLFTVFIFIIIVNFMLCLAKPPGRKCPSFVFPLRPSVWRSCSLTLTTDSRYLTTEGEETTQPGSDNILLCCICCLFVHFNNSYKIKKKVKELLSVIDVWVCRYYLTERLFFCTCNRLYFKIVIWKSAKLKSLF